MFHFVFHRSEVVMYVVERHPNGSSRTVPATDVFTHLNQNNIKVMLPVPQFMFFNSDKASLSPAFVYFSLLFAIRISYSTFLMNYDCHKLKLLAKLTKMTFGHETDLQ